MGNEKIFVHYPSVDVFQHARAPDIIEIFVDKMPLQTLRVSRTNLGLVGDDPPQGLIVELPQRSRSVPVSMSKRNRMAAALERFCHRDFATPYNKILIIRQKDVTPVCLKVRMRNEPATEAEEVGLDVLALVAAHPIIQNEAVKIRL